MDEFEPLNAGGILYERGEAAGAHSNFAAAVVGAWRLSPATSSSAL